MITSVLTKLEFERTVIRLRTGGELSASREAALLTWFGRFLTRANLLPIDEAVLARAARPFPVEPVRSLDAIHLATISQLQLKLRWFTVVSRDERMRDNAEAMGLRVVP